VSGGKVVGEGAPRLYVAARVLVLQSCIMGGTTPSQATLEMRAALLRQAADESYRDQDSGTARAAAVRSKGGQAVYPESEYWKYDQNGWRPEEIAHAMRDVLACKAGDSDGSDGEFFLRENAARDVERRAGWGAAKGKGSKGFWFVRGSWLKVLDDLVPNHQEEYNTNGAFSAFKTVTNVKLSEFCRLHFRFDYKYEQLVNLSADAASGMLATLEKESPETPKASTPASRVGTRTLPGAM
jgi:hypothetical protein